MEGKATRAEDGRAVAEAESTFHIVEEEADGFMKIGLLREIKQDEYRVALTPGAVEALAEAATP